MIAATIGHGQTAIPLLRSGGHRETAADAPVALPIRRSRQTNGSAHWTYEDFANRSDQAWLTGVSDQAGCLKNTCVGNASLKAASKCSFRTTKLRIFGSFCLVLPASPTFLTACQVCNQLHIFLPPQTRNIPCTPDEPPWFPRYCH